MSDYSFIKFNDEIIQSKSMIELADLAKLLFKNKNIDVQIRKFSYYHPSKNIFYVSTFWRHRKNITELEGFKYELFSRYLSPSIIDYSILKDIQFESLLLEQIFLSLEHYRNRRAAINHRPNLKKLLKIGDNILLQMYQQSEITTFQDALLFINMSILSAQEQIFINDRLFTLITHTTEESLTLAKKIEHYIVEHYVASAIEKLHDFPLLEIKKESYNTPIKKDQTQFNESEEERETDSHQVDTKTGKGAKDANITGTVDSNSSQRMNHKVQNDYEDDVKDFEIGAGKNIGEIEKDEKDSINHYVHLKEIKPKINLKNYDLYKEKYNSYHHLSHQFVHDIKKYLHTKNNAMSSLKSTGKLIKNPTQMIMSNSHKVFYKTNQKSNELSVNVDILLDSSYSMIDSLEPSINGIIMLNHIFKELKIPHRIVSFYEDAFQVTNTFVPNYIHVHLDFQESLHYYPVSLLSIEAEGDNRDGVIIHHEAQKLIQQNEQDKIMILFTDGLPSAENYQDHGVIHTHREVLDARKHNIIIINIYVMKHDEAPVLDALQSIYGEYLIVVKDPKEIPKKLVDILRSVFNHII